MQPKTPDSFIMNPQKGNAPRELDIDFLKGILIVLMVYGHTTYLGHFQDLQNYLVGWIYTFHMPAFLMISGYFFLGRVREKEIMHPLTRRMIIPYLIFEALYLFGLWGANIVGLPTSNIPPATLWGFSSAVFFNPLGAFWFIHALIVIQVSFSLARYVVRKIDMGATTVWGLALLLLGVAEFVGLLKEWAAVYFVIGLLYQALRFDLESRLIVATSIVILCLILSRGEPLTFSLLQVAWVISIIGMLRHLAKAAPILIVHFFVWLGNNTLIILITHAIFTVGMKPFASILIGIDPSGFLNSLFVVVIAIFGGLILAKMFDLLGLSQPLFGTDQLYISYSQRTSGVDGSTIDRSRSN